MRERLRWDSGPVAIWDRERRFMPLTVSSHEAQARTLALGGGPLSRPRVLLADDHLMLVDALKKILEPDCEVVGR